MNIRRFLRRVRGVVAPAEDTAQMLSPGPGWGGVPTPDPDPVGSPGDVGYRTIPVMGWDIPPGLDVDEVIYFSLIETHQPTVAERALGVKSNVIGVRYSVDGAEWKYETRRRTNPQNGTPDTFFIGIDPAEFPDGKVEVRAIPVVSCGHSKVMQGDVLTGPYHSMILHMNAGGSLFAPRYWVASNGTGSDNNAGTKAAPFATLSKARAAIFTASGGVGVGGGRIRLRGGSYSLGDATENLMRSSGDRWLYIEAEPGEDVVFDRMHTNLVNFTGLNVSRLAVRGCRSTGDQVFVSKDASQYLLLEDHQHVGAGQQITGSFSGSLIGTGSFRWIWARRTTYKDARNGLRGARLIHDVHYERIGEDAFTGVRTGILSTSNIQDRGAANSGWAGAWHPDFMAFDVPRSGDTDHTQRNTLLYHCHGVDISAQIFFADTRPAAGQPDAAANIEGFGIVNCSVARRPATNWQAWFIGRPFKNGHINGLVLTGGGAMDFTSLVATYEDVVFDDVFTDGNVNGLSSHPEITVRGGNMV